MTALRLSLVQTNLQWQAAEANRRLLQDQLQDYAGKTDLVILPEMFTSAFSMGTGEVTQCRHHR
jgi:omega-amidase